jgi:hypothetical protein|tara:strand:+ start:2649 stop:3320 length:672 start_codon:yes stop_codon:yes gene_type:complete
MKHKIKPIYLPTEDNNSVTVPFLVTPKGSIYKHVAGGEFRRRIKEGCVPHHVYITVSEPIEEGDWCIITTENANQFVEQFTDELEYVFCRKIISGTDPKLKTTVSPYLFENGGACKSKDFPLPQPQQSFLKEFVANPDGEYEVEYEEKQQFESADDYDYGFGLELKLNQDNTVNITSVQSHRDGTISVQVYSRAEVEELVYDAMKSRNYTPLIEFNSWIKENL